MGVKHKEKLFRTIDMVKYTTFSKLYTFDFPKVDLHMSFQVSLKNMIISHSLIYIGRTNVCYSGRQYLNGIDYIVRRHRQYLLVKFKI